jgi:peptide chain release factor 1
MKSTLKTKLDQLLERYEELGALMSDSDVISDQNMFRAYSREYAEIEPVVLCYRDYERQLNELDETKILASDEDEDIRAMAAEELDDLQSQVDGLDQSLQKLLLPRDPNDSHNVFLEIRAGTGGDEAGHFRWRPVQDVPAICRDQELEGRDYE